MWTLWLALTGSAVAASPGEPPAAAVAPSDAAVVRQIVDEQIAAFQRDDAAGAWKHVAPSLREKFGTAETFLWMVRQGYRPVYAPRSYTFGPLERTADGLRLWLDLVGPDGEKVQALYLFERQADGTWKTSGCLLFDALKERTAT